MRLIICVVLVAIASFSPSWVGATTTDNICISAYVPEEADMSQPETEAVTAMLNRLMTTYGCAGGGFDNRFIVVPSIREVRKEVVGIDSKIAVELDIYLFLGDGINGTLFSTTSFTVKGIGSSPEKARISALRKAPARSNEMQSFINLGKERIISYYEAQGPSMIKTAQTLAQSHDYENAISILFAIPSTCSHFEHARTLAGEYGLKCVNNQNDSAIRSARQAWSADPTETGAAAAMESLNKVTHPTSAQKAEIEELLKSIDAKFTLRETRVYQAQMKEADNRHEERMADISSDASVEEARYAAAVSIAKSYAASRPGAVYHIHSWY